MIDFGFWESTTPRFLDHDKGNPSRDEAGEIVWQRAKALGRQSMVEVGFGGALDYREQFAPLVADGVLDYCGVDGCRQFVEDAKKKHPEAKWMHGTFGDLEPAAFDIAYSMAVLEHQPELEPPLSQLLSAVKPEGIAIVNWYRRPTMMIGGEIHEFNESERVHYVTWSDERIMQITEPLGWRLESAKMFPANAVYVFAR